MAGTIEERLTQLRTYVGDDAAARTRALVDDIEKKWFQSVRRLLLGNALLLLAQRLREDGDPGGTIATAKRAEEVFEKAREASPQNADAALGYVHAVRMHGAALLRLRKLDDAMTLLDQVASKSWTEPVGERRAMPTPTDPVEYLFVNAATHAERGASPAWFRALLDLAEHLGDRRRAEQARAGLNELVERARRDVEQEGLDDVPGPMR
jgi:tetratricopeptide (TPR) repeat protein